MPDILICAIAVIASLIIETIINVRYLNSTGIMDDDFKSLRQFAHKNKNLKQYANIFEELNQRIDHLEALTRERNDYSQEIAYLRRNAEELKNSLNSANSWNNNENMTRLLKQMAENISKLEEAKTNNEAAIQKLNARIAELEQRKYSSSTNQPDIAHYESEIQELNQQMKKLSGKIDYLEKYCAKEKASNTPEVVILSDDSKITLPKSSPKKKMSDEFIYSLTPITPDKHYIITLRNNLLPLKGKLGMMEYNSCLKILDNLLDEDVFDDSEEVMFSVNEMIRKYIYGSDTKVVPSDWIHLENYIRNAGYSPLPVKAGDNFADFRIWFERPIPASGGISGTIKQIQLLPYAASYREDNETEFVKLFGKCTYYK